MFLICNCMTIRFKNVEYWYVKGSPGNVLKTLNRSIGQYKRNYRTIKIGITGRNPQSRFDEHKRNKKWDRMIVIYRTSSVNFANKIEEWLTLVHWPDLVNKKIGGGSELTKHGYNYTYILLKGKII